MRKPSVLTRVFIALRQLHSGYAGAVSAFKYEHVALRGLVVLFAHRPLKLPSPGGVAALGAKHFYVRAALFKRKEVL